MTAETTLSAKGQVVIPKDVRDALGLKPGQRLEVVQTNGGVLLRPRAQKSGRSNEEILESIRKIMDKHPRPPLSIEDMNEVIADGWRKSALRR